jgi:type VI secretion system Hcp family effector
MPGNTFIKFQEIDKGESYQKGHHGDDGWIEISDWSWDVESETSFLKGGGSAVGKPQPGTLSITHYYDLSSPIIMQKIVAGTHFAEVTIDQLKQIGDKEGAPATFFQIKMKNAFVTKVSTKGAEDGSVTQDVEMVFKEVAIGYKAQTNEGGLETALKQFNWNVAQMNETVAVKISI